MRKSILVMASFFMMSGCTSAADIQRECASTTKDFAAQIDCIEARVEQEPSLRGNSFVTEYLLAGKVLAEKVEAGAISENEAQLQFAREYNELVMQQQRYQAYNSMEMNAIRPRHTVCRPSGGGQVICDTY